MLNVTANTHEAISSSEVATYNLYELYYEPPDFAAANSYSIGSIVSYGGSVYTAIASNPSPAVAPPNASYWEVTQYPFCITDWSEPVSYDGKLYSPATVRLGKITVNDDGRIQDTPMRVGIGHDDMTIMQLIEDYDLIGKKIIIVQIIEGADDRPAVTFKIKGAKPGKGQIDLSLSLGFGYLLTQVPGRTIYQNYCRHQFKGDLCKYSGADATCDHTFDECNDGKNNIINFGGFPGVVNNAFFF